MTLEVKVGPPQVAIHTGSGVLLTEPDGQIIWHTDKGLYFNDTRLLSSWSLYANGEAWELLNGGSVAHYASRTYLTNRVIPTQGGDIPAHSLALVLNRTIGAGVHEDIDVTNHGRGRVTFNLEIALRSDFADIFEVKADRIVRRGHIVSHWDTARRCLVTTYSNGDFRRGLQVGAWRSSSEPVFANGRISFEITLEPGKSWHTCLLYELIDGDDRYFPPPDCMGAGHATPLRDDLEAWSRGSARLESPNADVVHLFDQAVDDMAALRLPFETSGGTEYLPAAGLPWFVALFGRDSLIVALQNQLVNSAFAIGALEILGRWQAQEYDPERDAEPGKIPHELRRGELAHFHLVPHTPYYGTADATPLYLVTLHNAWRSTGSRALLDRHLSTAERCLEWIDRDGDRDGDGLQEYATRSRHGYENMAWKDAGEALVMPDGSPVRGPKALCELQGYVYDAWRRMAEIFRALGREADASALEAKAAALREKFDAAFWVEEEGFYAYALDGEKRQVATVASNPGHCLWSGIVPPARAGAVVRRLMRPDMWSGWGIRTLSADNPTFNPYSYQNGSVWPHDNSLIAMGFRRYGFAAEAAAIARDVFHAGGFFALGQLPELYAGIPRDDGNFPVQYVGANVPQAWAAGSVFALLTAMLGFRPDAPRGRLLLDPALPDWLPEVTLRNVRVGPEVLDIRFRREADGTSGFEVLRGNPASCVAATTASDAGWP